jgi:2-polyprenyl-6-methoxyphenol hydroxylase-like FAD-dependent oxidoreductase
MAAESAVILARLLGENPPSEELYNRYTSLRRPRTDAVSMTARKTLNNMLSSGIWRIIRDLVITMFGGYFLRSGMMGHYGYDAGTATLR